MARKKVEKMENEKLNIEQMVKEYTSTTNDTAHKLYLDKIQVVPYLPYLSKMIYAQRIVESTSWDKDHEKIEINSPIRHILYIYTLLLAYTNVDVHQEDMIAEYDALSAAGMVQPIIEKIPEHERKEFDKVLKMVTGDYYTNHFETHAYIDHLVDRFKNIVENFFSPISEDLVNGLNKLNSEDIANAITNAVAQVGKEKKE